MKIRKFFGYRNLYYMLLLDALLVVMCFYLAYVFRFEFSIPPKELSAFSRTWPYVLIVKMATFAFFHMYKGMWRYTSLVDLFNVIKGVFTSSILIIIGVLMVHRFQGYPRSVFIIDGFLTFLAIGGIRVVIRLYFAQKSGVMAFPIPWAKRQEDDRKRLLIIGAGGAGEKAVRPSNVMGASKRVAELLLQSYVGNHTRMMAVRFGNVVGSSGSVVPLFREQIARGGPVTVSHPDVTRYFMTISEACRLILQAGSLGADGEIFILEMGTPVRIWDMARDLIRLSGKEPDRDIEIVFKGLEAGEKLYEELITEGEGIVPTDYEKIMVLKPNGRWGDYGDQEGFRRWLMEGIEELYKLADQQDARGIREKLKELAPEYTPQETECVL